MVQFLSINFFSWISSIFVGFFKTSRFFVSLCILAIFICVCVCGIVQHLQYVSSYVFPVVWMRVEFLLLMILQSRYLVPTVVRQHNGVRLKGPFDP